MITTAFINIAYSVINFFIELFPIGSGLPISIHNAVQQIGGYLHILDPLVPISILLTCVSLIFSVEIAIFGFKTFKWVFGHVPIVGGKGN